MTIICEMKEVLANAARVIIVRCPNVASQHGARFKRTRCDVWYISMRPQEGDWYWTGNQHAIDTLLIPSPRFYPRPLHSWRGAYSPRLPEPYFPGSPFWIYTPAFIRVQVCWPLTPSAVKAHILCPFLTGSFWFSNTSSFLLQIKSYGS